MADFKWIDKSERLPTRADANNVDHVYGIDKNGVRTIMFENVRESAVTHWLPFNQMPLPKRWRVATIHHLAVRLKAIPCRVRNRASDPWQEARFMGYGFWDDAFLCDGTWWKFCEIEDAS